MAGLVPAIRAEQYQTMHGGWIYIVTIGRMARCTSALPRTCLVEFMSTEREFDGGQL
jgi:hypothetical protein